MGLEAFYCPGRSLPPGARSYFEEDEIVLVYEDGRVEPYDGPVAVRSEGQGAEPLRPRMRRAAVAA